METATYAPRAAGLVSIGAALLMVLLPGRLERQVRAASSLPTWIALLITLCLVFPVLEICAYTGQVLDRLDSISYVQQMHLPYSGGSVENALQRVSQVLDSEFGLTMLGEISRQFSRTRAVEALLMLTGIPLAVLAGLELLNLVLLAPFGASWGERFLPAAKRTRKLMLSLGSVGLLYGSLAWLVLSLVYCTGLHVIAAYHPIRYGDFLVIVGAGLCISMGLLLPWALRLIRAAGMVACTEASSPAARCSACGYLLEGLAEGAGCPECGTPDPEGVDRNRQPAGWTRRSECGRVNNLLRLSAAVVMAPSALFSRIRLLDNPLRTRWFLAGMLGLSILSWAPAVAGMTLEMAGRGEVRWVHAAMACIGALAIGLVCTLGGLVVIGLLILLIGWRIGVIRQEPAWPIAASAGCHLAGWFPWIFAAQALWLLPIFAWDANVSLFNRLYTITKAWGHALHVDGDFVYGMLVILPGLILLGLMLRATVVCYRNVRYACR